MFDSKKAVNELISFIRGWFAANGDGCSAVIGISGGKDSSVAAALCVRALGAERVIGVLMPNGEQSDIDVSYDVVNFLGIRHMVINIKSSYDALTAEILKSMPELSAQSVINLAPRLRMATLYAVSQSNNGRVINTCNLSEDWVGYSTRYGDAAGDVSPLSDFTVCEVKMIGRELGLPPHIVDKVPSDGLCGRTDEDNLGFTYDTLDRYIRTGVCEDAATKALIDKKHFANKFKLMLMGKCGSGLPRLADD